MLSTRVKKIKDRMFNVDMVTKRDWWGLDETILNIKLKMMRLNIHYTTLIIITTTFLMKLSMITVKI